MDTFRDGSANDQVHSSTSSYYHCDWHPPAPQKGYPPARKRISIEPPPPQPPQSSVMPALKREFKRLVKTWRSETQFVSDAHEVVLNRAYQRIIGLGPVAVSLVIKELEQRNGHWFWALNAMTGDDPVPEEHWGDFNRMKDDWLQWWQVNAQRFS